MVKNTCSAGAPGSTPWSGRSSREGHDNHSSILLWRIPWTEEPGGLQSMGSQRVRHNRVTNTYTHILIINIEKIIKRIKSNCYKK